MSRLLRDERGIKRTLKESWRRESGSFPEDAKLLITLQDTLTIYPMDVWLTTRGVRDVTGGGPPSRRTTEGVVSDPRSFLTVRVFIFNTSHAHRSERSRLCSVWKSFEWEAHQRLDRLCVSHEPWMV